MTRRLSLVVVALAVTALGWGLWAWRAEWLAVLSQADGVRMARSLLLLVGIFWLDALGWHLILCALGQRPTMRASFWVWMASSLGRYLPGGIWPYASRIVMAVDAGIPMPAATLSLYLETLLLAVSSLAVGLPALLLGAGTEMTPLQAGLGVAACLIALHPRFLSLLRRLPGRIGAAMAQVQTPSTARMLLLGMYYFGFWGLFGLVFWDFCAALAPALPMLPTISAFALAFFIGFLALFVPGGLGVREAAIYALLIPHAPPAAGLAIAVGSRFWVTAGEAASVVVAWMLRPRH